MEASPRKKKRSAKDAKKSAKQREEKSTNSIDEEVSTVSLCYQEYWTFYSRLERRDAN